MDLRYILQYWDLAGCPWAAHFYVPSFSGTVETLQGSGDPVKIEFQNGDDDYNDPFRPSQAVIEIKAQRNWKFTHLFDPNIMHTWVEIYQGEDETGSLFFRGWVDPVRYEEPYDVPPYYLTITVVDGLTYLQDIRYVQEELPDGSFVYYEGRVYESQIIYDILQKIGIGEWEEYLNLFDINMTRGASYSPITQLLIENDRFRELTCADVLEQILNKYGAVIRQHHGMIQVIRPIELLKPVMTGRRWLSATESLNVSFTTEQRLRRREGSPTSPFIQTPGGSQMLVSPAKRININQEYGSRDSWVYNHSLHKDSYDPAQKTFRKWTWGSAYDLPPIPIGDIVPREDEGALIKYYTGMSQQFGAYTQAAGEDEMFRFEFEYGFYNTAVPFKNKVTASFSIYQSIGWGPWLWTAGKFLGNAIEDTELAWYDITWGNIGYANTPSHDEIGHGWSGWFSASYTFRGMPYDVPINISFTNKYSPEVYVCIKNVRFTSASAELSRITYQRSLWERLSFRRAVAFLGGMPWDVALRSKYILKDDWNIVDQVVVNTYNPVTNVPHGDELDYNFTLGDVVKESDPPNKGDTRITNNIEQFAGSLAVQAMQNVTQAATSFVKVWSSVWDGVDIILDLDTSDVDAPKILFKAALPGGTFSPSPSVSAVTGNITTTVTNVSVASVGTRQKITFIISGTFGSIDFTLNGKTRTMEWAYTMRSTINQFIRLFGFEYLPLTFSIDDTGTKIIITGDSGGNPFTVTTSPDGLTATQESFVTAVPFNRRVDAVEVKGTTGTALISCGGVSRAFGFSLILATPSSKWRYDGAAYNHLPQKRLLEIIGDEIASQYSRSKYLVQMPIFESVRGERSILNINGCLIDPFNKVGLLPRRFAINRGSFSTRHRMWELDLIELLPYTGPKPAIPYEPPNYDVEDPSDWITPEDSDYVPESEGPPPQPEMAVTLNNIVGTIPDGRMDAPLSFTFSYTALSSVSAVVCYYFSSDAAGENMVGSITKYLASFSGGTHNITITTAKYPSYGTRYLQVYLEDKIPVDLITSNQFASVSVVINSLAEVYSPQTPTTVLTPRASINVTAQGGIIGVTVYWAVRDSGGNTLTQHFENMNFGTGTVDREIYVVFLPGGGPFLNCTLGVGLTPTATQVISNPFDIASM